MALDQTQMNVPTGLQHLAATDTLLIKQKVERLECNFEHICIRNEFTLCHKEN